MLLDRREDAFERRLAAEGAAALVDVPLELLAEVAHVLDHRARGEVAERAEALADHPVADREQELELALLGTAFSLFAAAELVYMTYHLDWTVFLFAHTIAEVLDLSAFVLVFAGAVYQTVRRAALETS